MQHNGQAPASTNGTLLDGGAPTAMPSTSLIGRVPARKLSSSAGKSLDAQLVGARLVIETVLSQPGMLVRLAPYGYDAKHMRAGRALYERALALHQQQQAAYGQRYAATDARDAAQAKAHAAYIRHLAVARVALRGDRGVAQALGLASGRKKSHAGWLSQAQQFYANAFADSAIERRLAAFGVPTSQLAEAQRLVAAVEATLAAQQTARDAALALTKQRDLALDALRAWMRDFRAIARIALPE